MIKIKTPVDKINYILPTTKMMLKIEDEETGKIEFKECEIAGSPKYDTLDLTIIDEFDAEEWINTVYNSYKLTDTSGYKNDIEVQDKNGISHKLFGCFPINVFQDQVTIVFDLCETNYPKFLDNCPFCTKSMGMCSDGYHNYQVCNSCGAVVHPPTH